MKIHSLSLLCALSGAAVAASDSKAGLLSNGNGTLAFLSYIPSLD